MGFGLLFIGYLVAFLMSVNAYGWAFKIVGFYIIFLALQKLSEYKHSVQRCLAPLIAMTLCQMYYGFVAISRMIAPISFHVVLDVLEGVVLTCLVSTVFLVSLLAFHWLLFLSIHELAIDVEDTSISKMALQNRFMIMFYVLLDFVTVLFPVNTNTKLHLMRIVLLFGIVYPIVVLYMFYRCYAGICAPEDADMTPKPSRFAFVNKSRAMSEKNEKEMQELLTQIQEKKKQKQQQKRKKK